MMPTAEDFRVTLRARMQGAEHASKTTIEINSGQLHREAGGYPGQNHWMPPCCAVMRSEMSAGDAILQKPPKKQGTSLTIRYNRHPPDTEDRIPFGVDAAPGRASRTTCSKYHFGE